MFLTAKWNEEKRSRGWNVYCHFGTAADTPATIKRERKWLDYERQPYRAYTIEWMDRDATIWHIELWYVKEIPNCTALILKCDSKSISATGIISLPRMLSEYQDGKHVEVGFEMKSFGLAPSWFETEVLQNETIIYRVLPKGDKVTGRHVGMQHNLFSEEVAVNDNLHPLVKLDS